MFKQRKNRQFQYRPRFQDNKQDNDERNLESQWKDMKTSSKRKRRIFTSLPFLVLFLITVLILFYFLTQYEST